MCDVNATYQHLGRMSVTVKIVGVVQEYEEVICSGRSYGQKDDFPYRNSSTQTGST